MLSGLRNAFLNRVGTSANVSAESVKLPDLDRLLEEDLKTRKQKFAKFNWYQEKIKTRHAAEIKLRHLAGT